jgi:hypothetical protein
VADLNVIVVDTGAFNTGYGHFNVADSLALQRILTRMRDLDRILPDQGGARRRPDRRGGQPGRTGGAGGAIPGVLGRG